MGGRGIVKGEQSPDRTSLEFRSVPFPRYLMASWRAIETIWLTQDFRALSDYLFSRNAFQKTLHSDSDRVPTEESWARWVFAELIHEPILQMLEDQAIAEAVDDKPYALWHVEQSRILETAERLTARHCKKLERTTVLSPIIGVRMAPGVKVELDAGITIEAWSLRDRCRFLSRYPGEFHDQMSLFGFFVTLIQVVMDLPIHDGTQPAIPNSLPLERILSRLDLLKWAFMLDQAQDCPFGESIVAIENANSRTISAQHRQEGWPQYGSFDTTEAHLEAVKARLKRFAATAAKTDEVDRALWHFGRSCVSALPRDVLLEAAIGLELLLVPDPGDSNYKFSLHGSVLLSKVAASPQETSKLLGEIYKQRSRAAHGAKEADFKSLAARARMMLGQAIAAVIDLDQTGAIELPKFGGDIGKAMKAYVFARATRPGT
jgi:hypothetical protein